MSLYEVRLGEDSQVDCLLDKESGSRLMLKRLGGELIGYRITDPAKGMEIPLLYRDSLVDEPERGWKGHATVLFPIVGGLKNKASRLGTRTISSPGNHGIARHSTFSVVAFDDSNEASIHYRLTADDYTREYYPFEFQLDLIYRLKRQDLSVTFEVFNPGEQNLYYSLGWHPGFSTPILAEQGRKSDCRLVLPVGQIRRYHNNEHCRLTGETSLINVQGPLEWSEEGLERTYMYEIDSPDRRWVRLEDPGCGVSVRVDFPEFPHLGFWSEPGDPFICIEPWQGMDDHEDQESFDQKVGIMTLEAGGRDRRAITVVPTVG